MSASALRRLDQPGPVSDVAWRAVPCRVAEDRPTLPAGGTLAEALIALAEGSAAFILEEVCVAPLVFNLPSLSDDPARAAWYAGPFAAGRAVIESGCVFVGEHDGAPAMHCHARWRLPDGTSGAGHILLDRTVIARAAPIGRARIRHAVFAIEEDAETNFSIFHPVPRESGGGGTPGLLVKLSPNVDFVESLEAVAAAHDMPSMTVIAAVGSLVGGAFADAPPVADPITEVFAADGQLGGRAGSRIAAVAVDPAATVHQGTLRRGANAVGITFEVLMAARPPAESPPDAA